MKNIYFKVLLFVLLFFPAGNSFARENVTDWYIRNFDSEIVVNKDSSLEITETIIADCGEGIDKHGIFRILPEQINIEGKGKVKTPVELISIEDDKGVGYNYTETRNKSDETVTWKIGSADKTVQGTNVYVIKYKVKNTIRFYNNDFDELYWNLTGNFWELEMDRVRIRIILPDEVGKKNSVVDLYAGALGEKGDFLANYIWVNDSVLEINSTEKLLAKQGITISVIFPKEIFIPYQPTFMEAYGKYLFLIIPIVVFIICFRLWRNYGDDPAFNKTTIAQYEPPKNIALIELGLLMSNGSFKNHFVTAEIINFATKNILTIKQFENEFLFIKSKDYKLIRTNNVDAEDKLSEVQKIILNKIFEQGNEISLSSLKNDFYKVLGELRKSGNKLLGEKNLIVAKGIHYSTILIPIGFVLFFLGFFYFGSVSGWELGFSMGVTGIITVIFGFIMPKRTVEGTEMNWQAKGFKLFMETVNKDRAKFYEEENIFEKLLPYAILFKITDVWIKRIKEIYGEEYFASHIPTWYAGSTLETFNADSFNSVVNDLSSRIADNTSSPSGSGGGGSSGGGGGGGGGGGW